MTKLANYPIQHGSLGNSYPAFVQKPSAYELPSDPALAKCKRLDHVATPLAGFTQDVVNSLATSRQVSDSNLDYGNMEELDDTGTSMNLVPQEVKTEGCWNYVSTRNNNFSNRSQKGTICVANGEYKLEDVGAGGKALVSKQGWLKIDPGSLESITQFKYQTAAQDEDAASHLVMIEPLSIDLKTDKWIELAIRYEAHALKTQKMMWRADEQSGWQETGASFTEDANGNSVAVANINKGGHYKVEEEVDAGIIAAIVIAILAFLGAAGYIYWRKQNQPKDVTDFSATQMA